MLENCEFYIEPRSSGKTYNLIRKFFSLDNVAYIGLNKHSIGLDNLRYLRSNNFDNNNFFNQHLNIEELTGRRFDYVLIDDYLFFEKENIEKFDHFLPSITKNIIIKTTAYKLINKDILYIVKKARELNVSSMCLDFKKPEVNYLFFNLISHPLTKLITEYDNYKKELGENEYKTQICGELFK